MHFECLDVNTTTNVVCDSYDILQKNVEILACKVYDFTIGLFYLARAHKYRACLLPGMMTLMLVGNLI